MPPFESKKEWRIFELFEIAILLKGINGVVELVLGSILLFFSEAVNDIVFVLTQNELIDDPNDFLATHIQSLLAGIPQAEHFGGIYLIAHGIVKVTLVAGLWRNKPWAYPSAIVIMSLFIVYQLVRVAQHHSLPLLAFTLIDCGVVWLIAHEYRRIPPAPTSSLV
jgi:uncharacterized membrane protein